MTNLSRIVKVCVFLGIDCESVELFAGHKEVLFSLPDSVIEGLYEDGELGEKYDEFCHEYGIDYVSECNLWVA